MKICLAQSESKKGDINWNISNHKKWIEVAISQNADLIVFPELSLTGYEPNLANKLATDQNDLRLNEFQELSDKCKISIGVGLPTKTENGILISMVIFQPNQQRQTYSKQELHSDEKKHFIQGNEQIIIPNNNERIAPAICYESLQQEHIKKACELNANIYLASVAKPQDGIEKALNYFPKVAKQYSMLIFMVNCIGFCDNFKSVGQTSIWDENGILIGQLDSKNESMLIFDTKTKEIIIKNEN
ncbi:MAG: carbon-nitrogen hydrolase family protein [Flavobacterium sp.]|nr:MAG: carbon-nitrogen hydrolase family protein [Flavobacterium sp.]